MKRQVIVVVALLTLAGCIDASAADRDARKAVEHGDCRLVAVYGFSTETPGADYETRERLGYRAIEGTSDVHTYPWDGEINRRARTYAESYNQVILERCTQ